MRRGLATLAVAAGLSAALSAVPAMASGWRAGAARVDVTPPPFNPTADAQAFPLCPQALWDGPRRFALQEPYRDANASGEFNYETDLYCDANANGRYDGIYVSGGPDHLARRAHDPIDARALALSDGERTVVVVSVVAQGLFENYVEQMRSRARERIGPGLTDMVVSANHNESSPDTIGIYGAPVDPTGTFGLRSGIDEYYMDFLVEKVARAVEQAYQRMVSARLSVGTFQLPDRVTIRLSNNFPTTNDDREPAAIDPKVRVLQARAGDGDVIATVMNLAAHNQEIGHSDDNARDLSSDWPGYFHDRLDERLGGVSMFLAGDNGSMEDPTTEPKVDEEGTYAQARATGEALAGLVARQVRAGHRLRAGRLRFARETFQVPVENNLFKAAFAGGLFGKRQAVAGPSGLEIRTHVSVLDVGPDLQLIANPGEAFPALMLGSPWGVEDAGCPDRANPPVPAWHASARFRFQVGLADDMIGYEIPAWAYSSTPGVFANTDGNADGCVNDADDKDPRGHQHKLETEGLGPTASNLVASRLADLLSQHRDRWSSIRRGRFLMSDGSLSRLPEGAVGVWLAEPGADDLTAGKGELVALPGIGSFGDVPVDRSAHFIDYDGQRQPKGPDVTTRGMVVEDRHCPAGRRFYVDVYPALDAQSPGPAKRGKPAYTGAC